MWPFWRRKPQVTETKIIREDEIESLLKEELEKEVAPLMVNFEIFKGEIKSKIVSLEESLKKIEEAELKIPDTRTSLLVEAKRKDFLKKMREMIKIFDSEVKNTAEDIISYCDSCMHAWTYANAVTLKDFLHIKDFFENEAKEVLKRFKELYETLEAANKKISEKKSRIEKIKEALKTYKDYLWLKDQIRAKTEETEKIKQSINELNERKSKLLDELSNIEESSEFKKLRELEKEKSRLEHRQRELASITVEIFSSFERPLRKLYKLLKNSNEPLKEKVKKYLDSPFDALIAGIEHEEILTQIKRRIESGEIEVKSEKVAERVDEIMSKKILEGIREEYIGIEKMLNEIAEELRKINVSEKKEKLKAEIKSVEDNIASEEKRLKEVNEKISEFSALLEEMKEELRKSLTNAIEKEVKIIFN